MLLREKIEQLDEITNLNKAFANELEQRNEELIRLHRQYSTNQQRLQGLINKYDQELSVNKGLIDLDSHNEELLPVEWKNSSQ